MTMHILVLTAGRYSANIVWSLSIRIAHAGAHAQQETLGLGAESPFITEKGDSASREYFHMYFSIKLFSCLPFVCEKINSLTVMHV